MADINSVIAALNARPDLASDSDADETLVTHCGG